MPEPVVIRAPGRVNLMGEHTDYNAGLVLPAAIDLDIRIELVGTADRRVEIELAATGEVQSFPLEDPGPRTGGWIDYVAGVAQVLMETGLEVGGLRGRLTSTLPMSAGLSSSAALELASAWALMVAAGEQRSLDRLALAQLCQRAENEYVGVQSGLMDQFAASCGVAGHALLLDCRSLAFRPVPIPAGISLVVVDTGARRRLATSDYNRRRDECERGVGILQACGEPVRSLRDADVEMLDRAAARLGDVVYRRCRHVVEENERTLAAVIALENRDRAGLGRLFAASHESLRDQYEVSSPALDAAVEIARATPGVIATRMTGGGFGGCTINLVEAGKSEALRMTIERDYPAWTGLTPTVYPVAAADGAGLVRAAAVP